MNDKTIFFQATINYAILDFVAISVKHLWVLNFEQRYNSREFMIRQDFMGYLLEILNIMRRKGFRWDYFVATSVIVA